MKLRVIILCLVALLVVGLVSLTLAQRLLGDRQDHKVMNHKALAPAKSQEDPPGTIDGAKNPESISDLKAYEVFLLSTAVSESASEMQKSNARHKFQRAQLDEKDTAAVMKTLEELFQSRLGIIKQADLLRKNRATENEFAELNSRETALTSSAKEKLMSRLSPDGAAKLHEHIMKLKYKIKLLPPPSLSK